MLLAPDVTDTAIDYGMPVHPVCDMFPLVGGDEREGLEGDIRTNGLLHPIVVHEGQLIDGRNRLLACRQVNEKPRFVEWRQIYTGPMSVPDWIWSVNAERRHLTVEQWLAVQIQLEAWKVQEAARLRQVEGWTKRGRTEESKTPAAIPPEPKRNLGANSPQDPKLSKKREPKTVEKLASSLGVSEHKVKQSLAVQKHDPDLLKQVSRGEIKLKDAAKIATAQKAPEPRKPKPVDVETLIRRCMKTIDAALEVCSEEGSREKLLSELIGTLEKMR